MKRLAAWIVAVACLVIAVCRPASAAVTASFSLVGTNPITATCPVKVSFNGNITGTPGTNVAYIFSNFVNGAPVVSASMNGTIPATGTLPVTETLNIDKAHAGFQSNELDVTSPNAAQGKVFFTVNCSPVSVSTPTPTPNAYTKFRPGAGQSAVSALTGVPIPADLTDTLSAKTCGDHGGFAGLFCPQALHDGYLVLVWDWQGSQYHPKADGFKVYRVDGGLHTLVDTQTNPQATISFQKPITGGFGGKCYAVTAYASGNESRTSASFCVPVGYTGRQSKSVPMVHWAYHYYQYNGCGLTAGLCVVGTHCGDMCVGWNHYKSGDGPTLVHSNTWWRSYIQFDPAQIEGLNVFKATLTFRASGNPTCFGGIGAASGQAWDTKNVPDASWDDIPHTLSSSGAIFDVTNIVRDWARGAVPNWGFAIKSNNEDTGAEDNGQCMFDLNPNGSLTIEYY